MSENCEIPRKSDLSAKEWEIVNTIKDSGVINFDQLGKLVAKVGPALFDPGVVADDYIASGYSSVIKVWKTGNVLPGLENVAALKGMVDKIR